MVHRLVLADGVEVPENRSVLGRVRAHVTIDRAGEYDAGNHRHRRRLCAGTAAAGIAFQLRRRRVPQRLAVGQLEREQPARLVGRRQDVGHRNVRRGFISRGSPLDAAERATLAGLELPQHLAFGIGIESPHRAGLLADHDDPLAAGQRAQDRRVAEVVIRPELLRAVLQTRTAADEKCVAAGHLVPPDDLAGLEIHRDHRVARLHRRSGVRVARADVEHALLLIDGRRVPHRRTGRGVLRGARRVLAGLGWRFGDGVALPQLLAGRRLERDHAAAERAALVVRLRRRRLLR